MDLTRILRLNGEDLDVQEIRVRRSLSTGFRPLQSIIGRKYRKGPNGIFDNGIRNAVVNDIKLLTLRNDIGALFDQEP